MKNAQEPHVSGDVALWKRGRLKVAVWYIFRSRAPERHFIPERHSATFSRACWRQLLAEGDGSLPVLLSTGKTVRVEV